MKKLEIELFRYRNLLFGRVLHMDESLRGKGELITDGVYSIESKDLPYITDKALFVNGKTKSCDGEIIFEEYESASEAIEAGVKYRELIDKLNSEEEPHFVLPKVVKII